MIFSATVRTGKPEFSEEERAQMAAEFARHEGRTVYVTITGVRPPRSLLQNAYLWGVVYDYISADTGQSPEEIHEAMKERFLPRIWTIEEGREVQLPKSTTRLNTAEMKKYVDEVVAFAAAELGITIPEPTSV